MSKAIIVDLDGTLLQSQHAVDFADVNGNIDWKKWTASTAFATVNMWCADIVRTFAADGYQILFLTARSDSKEFRAITETWLKNNAFDMIPYKLIMRDEFDKRPDTVIKEEIYNTKIAPYYNVSFAIDDKKKIVDMWRNIGVPALHCADY